LLQESRAVQTPVKEELPVETESANAVAAAYPAAGVVTARPPISEVLHDVYQDDTSPLN